MGERRQWPRYQIDRPLQLHAPDPSGQRFVGRLHNISVGGALASVGRGVTVGMQVEVAVELTLNQPVILKYVGEVIRVEPARGGCDVAVKFHSPQPTFLDEWPQS